MGNEDIEVNKSPVRLVFKDMDDTISLMGIVVRKVKAGYRPLL